MLLSPLRLFCFCALSLSVLASQLMAQSPPPPGAHVPGELRLEGLSRVEAGQPVQVDIWAIRPEKPFHYSGVVQTAAPRAELKLELRDANGKWVGGADPRFRHGKWQQMTLAADGLKVGRYEAVLTLLYDDLPFNQVRKRIVVLSPEGLAATQSLSAEQIAKAGNLDTEVLESGKVVAVLPKDRELLLPLSGDGDQLVYGVFAGPVPAFQSALAGEDLSVPPSGAEFVLRELYLGFGKGGADTLVLQAGEEDLHLLALRFEPVQGAAAKLAAHRQPTNRDRAVVINNDGFSEGFFDPKWKIESLPLQVTRYKDTDATQLDWCVLVSDVVSYRSKFAEFYGEHQTGKWATEGNKAARRFYLELEAHEPRMIPWLVSTGQEMGLPVWGSLRMSVSYGNHPFGDVFNGQMWGQHPEWRVKKSPDEPDNNDSPLSFAFDEVQQVRIGVLRELAEMGCEGVNLDYCRYPLIMGYEAPLLARFQKAHEEDGKNFALDDPKWVQVRQELHNEFLRKLRRVLDEVGKARGKRVPVSIRLPATKYQSFGFDPQTWIKQGLVDVLIPGFPGIDRWFDASVWTEMVKGSKVKVWINMEYYRHETALTELTDDQVAQGVKPGYQFKNEHEDYLRRAAEVYGQGADGMYIFNRWLHPEIFYGLSDSTYLKNWQLFQNPDNLDSEVKDTSKQ